LKAIALNGPINIYQIEKHTRLPHATVHKVVKKAYDENFLVVKTAKQFRTGLITKTYQLTFKGLLTLLLDERIWEHIDDIAERYRDVLPLVFGKWSFFKKQGLLSEVLQRLKAAVLYVAERWRILEAYQRLLTEKTAEERLTEYRVLFEFAFESQADEVMRELINAKKSLREAVIELVNIPHIITDTVVFGPSYWWKYGILTGKEQVEFLLKLKKDPELSRYIEIRLEELEKHLQRQLQNVKTWRKLLSKARELT